LFFYSFVINPGERRLLVDGAPVTIGVWESAAIARHTPTAAIAGAVKLSKILKGWRRRMRRAFAHAKLDPHARVWRCRKSMQIRRRIAVELHANKHFVVARVHSDAIKQEVYPQ
jgi:hypothetical protein